MREKRRGKRILSLLLIFVLCMGTWAGDVCTVRAAEEMIGEEEPEEEAGEGEPGEETEEETGEEETEEETGEELCNDFLSLMGGFEARDMYSVAVMSEEDDETRDPADLLAETEGSETTKFDDQIEAVTEVTVTVGGKEIELQYESEDKIDLSGLDSNEEIIFNIQTIYKIRYGIMEENGDGDSEPDDKFPIEQRDLIAGDYFTISIPSGLKMDGKPENLSVKISGDSVAMATAKLSDDKSGITYTFTENIDKTKEYYDIVLEANLELVLDKDALSDNGTTEAKLSIPGYEKTIILPKKASKWPDKISKSGEYDSDSHTITWTIPITPKNRFLAGCTLVDTLDTTYQELVSVSWNKTELYKKEYDSDGNGAVTVEGDNIEVVDSSSADAAGNDNGTETAETTTTTITYTFGESVITSGEDAFTVITRLNDAGEAALLQAQNNSSILADATVFSPSNEVSLNLPEDANQENPDASAVVPITKEKDKKTISKAYEQISADVIRWIITVNPDKARIWKAEVTDELQSEKLSLIDGTVKVSQVVDDTEKGDAQIIPKKSSDDSTQQIYYTYTEPETENSSGTDGGTEDGTSTGSTSAGGKLTVTFANAFLANKTYELTFDTKIKTSNDYDTNEEITFQNNAYITCYFPEGSGIDGTTWESGTITAEAAELKLNKTCTFNKKTGMITWKLEPSYGGESFNKVTITDYVGQQSSGTGAGISQKEADSEKAGQTLTEGNAEVEVWLKGEGNADATKLEKDKDYTCAIDEGAKTLTIVFKGKGTSTTDNGTTNSSTADSGDTQTGVPSNSLTSVELNQIYITYQTHADGWGVSADEDGSATEQTYYNTAVMNIDSKTPVYANADTGVRTDDMITKSAQSYYDNETGESGFRYTIQVNNDGVNLDSAVLVDKLSELDVQCKNSAGSGTKVTPKLKLKQVTIAVDGGTAEEITLASEDSGGSNCIYTGDEDGLGDLTLKLGESIVKGKKVTVTVDVAITNYKELFKECDTIYTVNTASVKTEIGNKTGKFTAAGGSLSEGQIYNKRVDKTYLVKEDGSRIIAYTIQINPWAADMGEVVLTDKLTDENVEYDDESFHLYHGIHDEEGNLTKDADAGDEEWSFSVQNNADGTKQAVVTINSCTMPYILEYQVLVLDGAKGTIGNNVELFSDGESLGVSDCSAEIVGGGSGSANLYGAITVQKLYQDPVTGEETPLAGATFGLIKNSEGNAPSRTAVTDEDGKAVFRALSKDKNYWVKEVEAPEGYAITGQSEQAAEAGTTVTFYNTHSTGDVEFTKTDDSENHKGLGGAGFLLYYEENGTTKLVKTQKSGDGIYQFMELADESTEAGDLITSANSGTAGRVKVTGLPWGEGDYYFVEVQAPTGYQADSTKQYRFHVMLESAGKDAGEDSDKKEVRVTYETGADSSDAGGCFTEGDTGCLITNSAYQFSLLVKDENGDPIPNVTVEFFTDEACTESVAFQTDTEEAATSFTTDADGRVTIATIDDSLIAEGIAKYYMRISYSGRTLSYNEKPLYVQFSDGSTYVMIIAEAEDGNPVIQDFYNLADKSAGGTPPAVEIAAPESSSGSGGSGGEGSGGGNNDDSDGGTEDSEIYDWQLPDAAAEDETESREKGRNVRTGDRTPIALYMVLAAAALGIFAWLTVLLKKKKKALHKEKD